MRSRSAISKLQAILLIDIIVIGVAAAGFYYTQSLPKPEGPPIEESQINLTALSTNRTDIVEGESVGVSVNATNIGGEVGNFSVNLMVDGELKQTKTIQLSAGETKTVEFAITDAAEGSHLIKIGDLEATISVSSSFRLSDLATNRTEAGIGEVVGILVRVINVGEKSGNKTVALLINNVVVETKTVQLEGGETATVEFAVIESVEGTYAVKIGDLSGSFKVTAAPPPPKAAEFRVSDLTIDPTVAEQNTPVKISVKVTNVGEVAGNYSVDLTINNVVEGNKNLQLSGGATDTAEFNVTKSSKGTYSVSIGGMSGEFTVLAPSNIILTGMTVAPYENWPGDMVTITARAENPGTDTDTLAAKLVIDNVVKETKTIQLAAGASGSVQFSVTAEDEGIHIVNVGSLAGGFTVVKKGYHTLTINAYPAGKVEFNVDGRPIDSWFSELLPIGPHIIVMPSADPTGDYTFLNWEDGSTIPTRTVNLVNAMTITASFAGEGSCPSLYVWNGTGYSYVAEVSNHGWLGYMNYVNEDENGTILSVAYWRNSPWDYIPLNASLLQPTSGYYNISLLQRWDEIFFLDSAQLLVVDHPSNVSVYSTMVEQYIDPNYMGKIYTVSKNPLTPVSAVNEKGENVLPMISKSDGVFTSGNNGKESPSWDNITWNKLTLNLGNLSEAKQTKLVIKAIVNWGAPDSYSRWIEKFFSQPVPNGTQPTPIPFMEVKDGNGEWVRVAEDRQFPLAPDGVARTYVVDLTGIFPTNDYSLRINNFWNVTYDYIGVDINAQQNITIRTIDPQGYLYQAYPATSGALGNFTRYGNVTQLLLSEDDKFAIGRHGDAVSLQFPASGITAPPEGMERNYFFFVSCWFKTSYANYGFGPNFGFTVDPLPFKVMSGFPYPLHNESYPFDAEHTGYLQQWNTRVISQPTTDKSAILAQSLPVISVSVLLVLAVSGSYAFNANYPRCVRAKKH